MDVQTTLAADQDRLHHLHPLTNPVELASAGPEVVVGAEGVYLFTSDGRRIIDMGAGLGNVNIGYGNPRLVETAATAMRQLSYGHTLAGRSHPYVAALSAKLTKLTREQYRSFFFASIGSDAVESAVKMALRYWRLQGRPEKNVIVSRKNSYHGNTIVAASITGNAAFHDPFGLPVNDRFHHVANPSWYRDGNGRSRDEYCRDIVRDLEEELLAIGPENIALFIAAANQGEPHEGWWPEVRRMCDEHDILLICDEVITGFGKTGELFAFQANGVEPDLFVMAKGISSGYFPISSVGVGEKVASAFRNADEVFWHVFTNCGHPVGAAVALENIAFIEENGLVERTRDEIGPHLRRRLEEFLELPYVGDINSRGLLGSLELDVSEGARSGSPEANGALLERMDALAWERGVTTHRGTLSPPMIITPEQIDEAMDILYASLVDAWNELNSRNSSSRPARAEVDDVERAER
jgi:putrescine aminotransferase